MSKLVLFDIDGILIRSMSLGITSVLMKKHFGVDPFETKVYMEGRTFRWILKSRLEEAGIKEPHKDKRFLNALSDISPISDAIKKGISVEKIPFVENLIKKLIDKKIYVGLLTGNTKEISEVKLGSVNLSGYFKIGAFETETEVRSELVPIAIKDAKRKTGIDFKKNEVFIIGDTIEDIKCAREGGVKIISVATGNESYEKLKKENPDAIFHDFKNTDEILFFIER